MNEPGISVSTAAKLAAIGVAASIPIWGWEQIAGACLLVVLGSFLGALGAVWESSPTSTGLPLRMMTVRMVPGCLGGIPLSLWLADHVGIGIWFLFATVAGAIAWPEKIVSVRKLWRKD